MSGIQGEQLRSIVQRIERLEEEKKTISDDIREVYAEAKGNGYDTAIIRKVVAARKQDRNERAEAETLFDLYMTAVDTAPLPLFPNEAKPALRVVGHEATP